MNILAKVIKKISVEIDPLVKSTQLDGYPIVSNPLMVDVLKYFTSLQAKYYREMNAIKPDHSEYEAGKTNKNLLMTDFGCFFSIYSYAANNDASYLFTELIKLDCGEVMPVLTRCSYEKATDIMQYCISSDLDLIFKIKMLYQYLLILDDLLQIDRFNENFNRYIDVINLSKVYKNIISNREIRKYFDEQELSLLDNKFGIKSEDIVTIENNCMSLCHLNIKGEIVKMPMKAAFNYYCKNYKPAGCAEFIKGLLDKGFGFVGIHKIITEGINNLDNFKRGIDIYDAIEKKDIKNDTFSKMIRESKALYYAINVEDNSYNNEILNNLINEKIAEETKGEIEETKYEPIHTHNEVVIDYEGLAIEAEQELSDDEFESIKLSIPQTIHAANQNRKNRNKKAHSTYEANQDNTHQESWIINGKIYTYNGTDKGCIKEVITSFNKKFYVMIDRGLKISNPVLRKRFAEAVTYWAQSFYNANGIKYLTDGNKNVIGYEIKLIGQNERLVAWKAYENKNGEELIIFDSLYSHNNIENSNKKLTKVKVDG